MWAKGWERMKGFVRKPNAGLISHHHMERYQRRYQISKQDTRCQYTDNQLQIMEIQEGWYCISHSLATLMSCMEQKECCCQMVAVFVVMKGMAGGGGGNTNINITVNGANGDGRKLARQISEEVARVMRTRSRGGSYSRGV